MDTRSELRICFRIIWKCKSLTARQPSQRRYLQSEIIESTLCTRPITLDVLKNKDNERVFRRQEVTIFQDYGHTKQITLRGERLDSVADDKSEKNRLDEWDENFMSAINKKKKNYLKIDKRRRIERSRIYFRAIKLLDSRKL